VDDCAKFIGQPTQYGVGCGSRLSILVVLDHSKEGSALGVFDALDREVFDEDVGRFEDQPPRPSVQLHNRGRARRPRCRRNHRRPRYWWKAR
jgi:hypothetical protein